MACKPMPLAEHIRKNGGFYDYDQLVSVVVTDDDAIVKRLKADFLDVFGFDQIQTSTREVGATLTKLSQRLLAS